MRSLKIFFLELIALTSLFSNNAEAMDSVRTTPKAAFERLMKGNQRYVDNKLQHPNRTKESREALINQQSPFAVVLGCSDSRVSPEIIFDEGIGDLFVVRVAGNVVSPIVLDSIEYSAIYLKSSIILVLGHENCGAVSAVVQRNTKDIESVAALIEPAIKASENQEGNRIENAIKTNVRLMVEQIKKTAVISKLIEEGNIDVVGGYYRLGTGTIDIIK